MKKLLLLLLLFPIHITGQTRQFRPDKQPYIEVNTGIGVEYRWKVSNRPFTSITFGTTIDMGDYSLIDMQAGFGFPSVVTGKFGLGSYLGKKETIPMILGVRLYPIMLYTQLYIPHKNQGLFSVTIEIGTGGSRALGYTNILNIGYKWPITFKKKK